jgi:hypothetical protein
VRLLAKLLVVAALAAAAPPAHAQGPSRRAIIPPAQPAAQPAAPGAPANSAAGLCQCLYPPSLPSSDFGKTHLRFACLGAADQCKSSCNTTVMYSFIPTAPFSCAPAAEQSNQVASRQ